MGRMTHGILYGIEIKDDSLWSGPDGDSGLVGEFGALYSLEVDATAKRLGITWWNAKAKFVPDREWSDDEHRSFLGFWISRGASEGGMGGVVQMSRGAVKEKWPREYKNARIRWRRFAKWCASKGVVTSKPTLWLLETEVA